MFGADFHFEGLGKFLEGVRFFYELADAEIHGPVDMLDIRVAGGDDCFLIGDKAKDPFVGFTPVDARVDHHVENNQVDR